MAVLVPVDTTKILNAIRDDLQSWATPYGGRISLATDAFNVLEILAESPANWRGIILWQGKTNVGGDDVHYGISQQRFSVIVSAQKALSPTHADVFVDGTRVAILNIVELLTERILRQKFDPTIVHRGYLYHMETRLYQAPAGINLHAYEITFTFHSLQKMDCNPVNIEVLT